MIFSVIPFLVNNRVNKIVILLQQAHFCFLKWKLGYDVRLDKDWKMAGVDVKERVISGARNRFRWSIHPFLLEPQHRTSSEDVDDSQTVESNAYRTI